MGFLDEDEVFFFFWCFFAFRVFLVCGNISYQIDCVIFLESKFCQQNSEILFGDLVAPRTCV